MERIVHPGAVVVRLDEGPCQTREDHERVKQALALAGRERTRLVVDCARVTSINGAFLAALLAVRNQLGARPGDLVLCNVAEAVRMVFEVTRLDQVFPLHGTCEEALQADWPEPRALVVGANRPAGS